MGTPRSRPVSLPASPKVVFFDVGGTLLNFSIEPSTLFSAILADHGVEIAPPDLYRAMRAVEATFPMPLGISAKSEADYWRAYDGHILQRFGVQATPAVLDDVLRRFKDELTLDCFPESAEVLEALRKRKVPLGVISNASHGILGDLERNGIAGFFDHIVYSQQVGAAKPDPRIFREALQRFGVAPHAAWHIGDNVEADIAGAQAMGIHAILVDRQDRHAGVGAPVVRDLRGLLDLVGEAG